MGLRRQQQGARAMHTCVCSALLHRMTQMLETGL
jgi:hypothetical protein